MQECRIAQQDHRQVHRQGANVLLLRWPIVFEREQERLQESGSAVLVHQATNPESKTCLRAKLRNRCNDRIDKGVNIVAHAAKGQ